MSHTSPDELFEAFEQAFADYEVQLNKAEHLTMFKRRGFNFVAIFDKDPNLIGKVVHGIEIRDVELIDAYLKVNQVDIAVLSLPRENALQISNLLVANGVKGIWNFSHVDLHTPKSVVVENVHLSDSLMQLSYNIVRRQDDK